MAARLRRSSVGYFRLWHDCDIALCRLEFRLRPLSGRVAETPGGPGLTLSGSRALNFAVTHKIVASALKMW
jgi:hypothetical protein